MLNLVVSFPSGRISLVFVSDNLTYNPDVVMVTMIECMLVISYPIENSASKNNYA